MIRLSVSELAAGAVARLAVPLFALAALAAGLAVPAPALAAEPITLAGGHDGTVTSVAFSPDGATLASGGWDHKAMLWDIKDAKVRATLAGHTLPVIAVAFSPDGKLVATGSMDKTVRLWNAGDGTARATLKGHTKDVNGVAFSPDGKIVASAANDGTVILWDVGAGTVVRKVSPGSYLRAVAWSPDGAWLVVGGDRDLSVWNAATGARHDKLGDWKGGHRDVEFSGDGKLLASCSTDGVVRLGTLEGAPAEWKAHTSHVMGLAWSPDGKWLATGAKDYKLKIWDAKSKAEKVLLGKLDKAIVAVATSPDGKWLATGSEDKTVRLWAVK